MEGEVTERCPTGIAGFDKLIEGGFPRGRTILVSGETGTGKTIFSVEFLCNGVSKYNENGILVTLEQSPEELKKDTSIFNFNLEEIESDGRIVIIDASLSKLELKDVVTPGKTTKSVQLLPGETNINELFDVILRKAKEIDAKRIIIDSIPALDLIVEDKREVRRLMLHMNYRLKSAGLTTIMITETSPYRESLTHGIESYVTDGVVMMHYAMSGEDAGRSLTINKMRATNHSENIHPIKFTRGKGIEVLES